MLSAAVFAAEDITLNAGKDLLVYTAGGDNGKIAAALNIDSEELSSYISENNVEYFAVNKENTVQIKLTVNITEFSSSVSNLSNLSDGNIESLLPEITGIDEICKNSTFLKRQRRRLRRYRIYYRGAKKAVCAFGKHCRR